MSDIKKRLRIKNLKNQANKYIANTNKFIEILKNNNICNNREKNKKHRGSIDYETKTGKQIIISQIKYHYMNNDIDKVTFELESKKVKKNILTSPVMQKKGSKMHGFSMYPIPNK